MDRRRAMMSEFDATEREASRVRHEATVTCRILSKLAPHVSIPKLKASSDNLHSVVHLGLVRKALPDFPLRLFANNVPFLAEVGVHQLLAGDLFYLPMFKAYMEHIETNGLDETDKCIGMVFPWPAATEVVLHNWHRHDELVDRHKGGGRFTMVTCKFSPPRIYCLEPLDSLVAAIAANNS